MLLLISNIGFLPKNISAQSLERFLQWNDAGDTFKKFGGPGAPIVIHTGAIGFTNCFGVPDGVRDGFFRSADIYIIYSRSNYGLPSLPIGSQLNDVGGVPNTITSAASGGLFIEELIGFTGNAIGEGTYSIVYDECQDGKLGPEDKVFDTAFEVELGDDVPNIPSSYVQSVKADAAKEAKFWTETSNLFKYGMKAIDLVKYSTNLLKCLGGGILSAKECGLLLLVEVGNKEGVKKTDFWSIIDVKKIVQSHLLNTVKRWAAIEADPPDMNFQRLSLINVTDTIKLQLEDTIRSSYAKLGNTLSIINAITDSFLHSIERYQGAVDNNNGEWGLIHAKKIKENSLHLANELPRINSILTNLENEFRDKSNDIDNVSSLIRNSQEQLKTTGFTINDTKFLLNHGLSIDEIKDLKNTILAENTFNSSEITNIIQELITLNLKTAKNLIMLSNQMDEIISLLESNNEIFKLFPTANPGGPYITNTEDQIVLNGSKSFAPSIPDGRNIIKWEWDLNGDLIFGDTIGETPIVSFNESFDGFLGLKVTDSIGSNDISFTKLIVEDNNNPPSINSFSPLAISEDIHLGDSIQFSVNASDHDNDQLNFDWYLNDALLSSSDNDNLNFIPNSIGFTTISVEVSDNNINKGIDSESWSFYVVPEDADNDGWNANIDCNDNNLQINPGTKEIRYNGIDDDCNPLTFDNNTPPLIQNKIHSVIQNSTTSILLQGSDIDNDPLQFIVVDKPENGTLGAITSSSTSTASISYTPNSNFHGTDKFTYIANDGEENSTLGNVKINIGIKTTPTPTSQTINLLEDQPINITLSAISHDKHPLKFFVDTEKSGITIRPPPQFGMLKNFLSTGPSSAEVTYIPPPNYPGFLDPFKIPVPDEFTFTVSDGQQVTGFEGKETSVGSIKINVIPVNDSPIPFDQTVTTKQGLPIKINLHASDVDNDQFKRDMFNHGLTFTIVNPPSQGSLTPITKTIRDTSLPVSTTDEVTYTPNPNFIGEDNFRFKATDGQSESVVEGNITIIVKEPNFVPKQEFEVGDIFLGTKAGGIQWYKPDGTFVKNLNSGVSGYTPGSIMTGGAFGLDKNLYMTNYDSLRISFATHPNVAGISKYNNFGQFIQGWRDGFDCAIPQVNGLCMVPESITVDKENNMYVGGAVYGSASFGQPDPAEDKYDDVRKFNSEGNLIDKFDVDTSSDQIELGSDQCTLFYTSESERVQQVKRYDICKETQLSDFGNLYGPGRNVSPIGFSGVDRFAGYALKVLPNNEILVASAGEIVKLNSNGKNINKVYDAPGENKWFSLNLDPDGKSFWAASVDGITIYKFDIETGKILQRINTPSLINGIVIYDAPIASKLNLLPSVQNYLVITNNNTPIEVNLTGSDIANDSLTFSIVDKPKFGTLSNNIIPVTNNISKVVYTPNPSFNSTDSFTYIANDGKLNSTNTGTILIARNHAPIATNDDGVNTLQGIPVNITVLANDSDIDIDNLILNDTISIKNIDTSESLGNVTLNSDNSTINYIPFAPQYIGQDYFNYTITDRYDLTDTAKVTLNVLSSNNIPVANNQTIETLENTAKMIQLIATDADHQEKLFYQIVGGPSNGFISNFNSTTGLAEYHPFPTFHGEDSFQFTVHDAKDKSLPGIVNITVIDDGINDAPRVESERVSANVSQQITIDVLQNDIDPNGDFLTLTNITGPFNGTAFVNRNQTITYQSDSNFNASDVLYYRVADQFGSFDIGQLIIDVQGDAENQIIQVPSDRLVTTTIDQPIDIELEATATIDRPVSFFIIDAPDNGILGDITNISNLTSSVRYTPNNNFVGNDSFTYVAQDVKGITSNIGTIHISVNDIPGGNNPPIAKDSQVTLDEDNSASIQLAAFDVDLTDSLTYSIESQPFNGKILDFDPSRGLLVYQPNPNFNGNDSFLFKAVDQGGLESSIATMQITVNPVNDPPVAVDKIVETNSNASVNITLEGTDVDQEDTINSFAIISIPTNGQISDFNSNTGTLTYTPNNNFVGQDFFTFKVIDSSRLESTNTGLVTINVKSPPNNEQTPSPLPSSVCTDSDSTVKPKGTQGNDELVGTSQRDVITGLGGNDRFNGCAGNDTLNGNSGNDGIAGGPGDDRLHGNEGNDYLQGDSGIDFLFGNEGNDILVGNEDIDLFSCGSGQDQILDFDAILDIKSNDCEEF